MPVKTMATPASSAAAMTSWSRIEPPGWMTAVAPAAIIDSRPSAKGRKASDATAEPLRQRLGKPSALAASSALMRGDAGRIDAAHLAGADADRLAVLGVDDGVGLHVLGHLEGELHVFQFLRGRRALGDDLQFQVLDHAVVAGLDEQAAGDGLCGQARHARIGQGAGDEQAQVRLAGDDRLGFVADSTAR